MYHNSSAILYPPSAILFFLLLAVLTTGCGNGGGSVAELYSDTVYQPEYAGGFIITGRGDDRATLITVVDPWQGASADTFQLLISPDGAPDGYTGQLLKEPAKRIAVMSSTHVAMLDALGLADRIVAVSGLDFITARDKLPHDVVDIGYEGGNLDYELLVGAAPDIVLLYGVNGASTAVDKLAELGIPYMYVGDYVEEDPLGKAEWMVALGTVTGETDKARNVFAAEATRYNDIKRKIAASLADGGSRPTVMFNAPYADAWYLPPARNYQVRLIQDAGARTAYTPVTSNASQVIDYEKAFTLVDGADFWLNINNYTDLSQLLDAQPRMTGVGPVANGRVYNNNARLTAKGGNDYYESAVVHPSVVLTDLASIFHPDVIKNDGAGESLTYYRHLK